MHTATVIESPGALCIETCRDVEQQILDGISAGGPAVVLNLRRTEAIDGAGVAVLLRTQGLARRTGMRLRFVAPSPEVRRFLRQVDLLNEIEFHDLPEEVLQLA